MDRSIRRLGGFLMLLFCALFVQLNYIQVFRANDLNTRPGNSRPVLQTFSKDRGTIATADGVVLARSVPSGDQYERQRQYPEGALYAPMTGYYNFFEATGLERSYNEELSGRTASQQVRSIGDLFVDRDRTGNLELSVRSDVQTVARDALGERRGAVVALDPRSGGVLALWNYPSFDPTPLANHDTDDVTETKELLDAVPSNPLRARSYLETYPPGSTFKVVTGATAVDDGLVTPEAPEYPTISALDLPQTDRNLPNFNGEACGGTFFQVLAKSCNTSFAQMGLDLTGPRLLAGAESFGFNDAPPFDLPTVDSEFPDIDWKHNQPALAQSAIGQNSVTATPLQMALVAAGIANDGVILEPHVVDEVRDGEGDLVRRLEPTQWKRAVSAQTADVMRQGMREVVATGSATRLQIPGLDVGAKTGTAQYGQTDPLRSHAWMIAWAGPPGEAPTVAVAVLVEGQEGASDQTGGRVAGPIAKAVIEAAMVPVPGPPASSTAPTDAPSTTGPGTGGG